MPYRILLVDDDQDFREELRECLNGYHILEASNGQEALRIVKKPNAIDLVILDVFMPGASGTDILKEIRKMSPHLGIIMLTGSGSKEIVVDALKGRADDYVEKPFDVGKLQKIIERLLAAKNNTKAKDLPAIGKIERVKNFLERNYDKKVCLKDAAEEICLSPKYLSRIFREKTGGGFNDFRLKVKIQMAEKMLRTSATPVQEISDKLGYKNLESFARIFKKITGKTPAAFRQKPKRSAHAKS